MSNDWRQFVLEHGHRAFTRDLAFVVGQSIEAVQRLKNTHATRRSTRAKPLADLLALWLGRAPQDGDWPAPRLMGRRGSYEWIPPEDALLATLVGTMGIAEISSALTQRLRKLTGDARARRSRYSVQVRIGKIGLRTDDIVGGLTLSQAAKDIGTIWPIRSAMKNGTLKARRVGRLWVIPMETWEAWKRSHRLPPPGYIPLSELRTRLGIQSDSKLPWWASCGHIPTAILCTPFTSRSARGRWYVSAKVARKLIADRRKGRPMPWHGRPDIENLRTTWNKLQNRRHPSRCEACASIWGTAGAPRTFQAFIVRYPELAHGAKRHLTRRWTDGLALSEVALKAGRPLTTVTAAVRRGTLVAKKVGSRRYVSSTAATVWIHRGCPTGQRLTSWIAFDQAERAYMFTVRELRAFIASGVLLSHSVRGTLYVSRHHLGELRRRHGFTEKEAARRCGVSVARFREIAGRSAWRRGAGDGLVPYLTVQAVRKRVESREGFTIVEAARKLGVTQAWIDEQRKVGTFRISRAPWDQRRLYVSALQLERLRRARRRRRGEIRLSSAWMRADQAAMLAGVCVATVRSWADEGALKQRPTRLGPRFRRTSVKARARRYWKTCRFHRATPPAWLIDEGFKR